MLEKNKMKLFWENQIMKIYVHGSLDDFRDLCLAYLATPTGKEFGWTLVWDAIAKARKVNLEELFI